MPRGRTINVTNIATPKSPTSRESSTSRESPPSPKSPKSPTSRTSPARPDTGHPSGVSGAFLGPAGEFVGLLCSGGTLDRSLGFEGMEGPVEAHPDLPVGDRPDPAEHRDDQ